MLYKRIYGISDNPTIVYVQDILVMKSHKRMGIGSNLLELTINKFKDIRQKILITEDKEEAINFYESNGFLKTSKKNIISFIRLDLP